MLTRLREMDPYRRDLLIGLVVAVEAQIEMLVLVSDDQRNAGMHAVLLLTGVAVAIRTRAPVLSVTAAYSTFAGGSLIASGAEEELILPFFVLFATSFSLGALAGPRRFAAGAAIACALTLLAIRLTDDTQIDDFIFGSLVLTGAPLIAGRVLRSRLQLTAALRAKAERLESERAAAAVAAAADERSRIAGELHDVVAHALSAMVVQASGARRLAERDPARASEAFRAVETAGREALTEIRGLLGVLRRGDEDLALAPQPSLRHVDSLVRRVRAAGLPVELDVEGEARELPIGVDLTAYRVVQEALGGALEHGHAGLARVKLTYGSDHVALEVADDGRAPARPLLGIRERVTLSGGTLRAGARRDGGHVVRAQLPLGGPA